MRHVPILASALFLALGVAPALADPPRPPAPAVPPTVPAYAPKPPVIPPPIAVPLRPPAPVPPAQVSVDAPGAATPLPGGGLRLAFGPGRVDLNPTGVAALEALARSAGQAMLTVSAFAQANGDDQSAPRRLSLARAMNVRSVLLHAGLASPQVILRAMGAEGAAGTDAPADRADIVPGPEAAPAPPTAPPAKAAP